MQALRRNLKYTTVIPTLFGLGMIATGSVVFVANAAADDGHVNPTAVARSSADGVQIAACNPCAVKKNPCNPCGANSNPCAAKTNPCNPCAASNPCNPCAAGGGKHSKNCVIPRLKVAANPSNPCATANPCAAKANPCNPCGAANPCAAKANPCNPCSAANPCAAKANPCNPCAAKNPCAASNPCNPCNPCSAAEAPELSVKEALAAYDCIKGELTAGYAKGGISEMVNYTQWENVATSPYVAATHGGRLVNNYVNDIGLNEYKKYEKIATMPVGSVVAKDSFSVGSHGYVSAGPMFLMEKMANGFAPNSGNWRYSMVMPDGTVFGRTKGKNSAGVAFCEECHAAVADDQDFLMLLPEESRK